MRAIAIATICAASLLLPGCGEKQPAGTTQAVQKGPEKAVAKPQRPGENVAGATSVVPAEFRLVKTANSNSVFVVKNGMKSAISNWGWVELNAPGKPIETITQAELDSYGDTGVTYK
jgi:hypothetical protein